MCIKLFDFTLIITFVSFSKSFNHRIYIIIIISASKITNLYAVFSIHFIQIEYFVYVVESCIYYFYCYLLLALCIEKH